MIARDLLLALAPEHCLLAGMVLLIVAELPSRRPVPALPVALVAVLAATAAALALALAGYAAAPFAGHFAVGRPEAIAKAIVLGLTVPVLLLCGERRTDVRFQVLLLSSLYGVCLLLSAESLLTLFLGLELMSLPVYVLVLSPLDRVRSAEAALKYLVLSATASATFLMGVSLLYGARGTLALSAFAAALGAPDTLATTAAVLITVAFFMKAAIVPFHTWAPDAYEGASLPITAYMATIVKAGVLLAFVRLAGLARIDGPLVGLIALLPLASIVWGNLAAMRQTGFRRMIAYSSIAHAGYLFYALLGDGAGRFQAVAFYVLAYGLMNVLAFASLPARGGDAVPDRLEELKGLFARAPYAAIAIAVAMLSLAGIPPLPGFVAKFLVFRNVMAAGYTTYAVLGLVGSYLGLYFYLRVIQYMFMSPEAASAGPRTTGRAALGASVLCLLPAILIALFPGWWIGRL